MFRKMRAKDVQLPDGSVMPKLGQGTWGMAEDDRSADQEIRAIRRGIELGMTLIDTAEMYADGGAENLIGHAIRGMDREKLYLISKVYPQNACRSHIMRSVEKTLKLLGSEYLDLYLLHWRGNADLAEVAWLMEDLKAKGYIRRWGVSNFDLQDMEELWTVPGGNGCCVNQVLYNLESRGIEYDLMEWQRRRRIPFIAYGPIGQAGRAVTESGIAKDRMMKDERVRELAERKGISVVQLLLAFVLYQEDVSAIPKAVCPDHIEENAKSIEVMLTGAEIEQLSKSFPTPAGRVPMEKY